ncbi:MAG: hypothetical protein V2I48_14050 [Xanthomonadales bacterium]|nr:hypothetical protein [Xanthomonadales bacterium]
MKRLPSILMSILAAAIAGCSYPIKDAGDGVYYASSPPIYTYVDGYFGFPYYGPYSWSWYHPTWYAPIYCDHYSWYRPRYHWGGPFDGPATGVARTYTPSQVTRFTHGDLDSPRQIRPILPVDLRQATIEPGSYRSGSKNQAFRTPAQKSRAAARSSKPAYSRSSRASPAYRASTPSRSPTPVRSSTPRSVSGNEQ